MNKWLLCLLGLVALTVQATETRPLLPHRDVRRQPLRYRQDVRQDAGYLPSSPPYYQGRFSNGPVWLEQLTQQFPGLTIANEAEGVPPPWPTTRSPGIPSTR